ncbi:MAG TPA: 2Fe-2S iron-sulfur cluster-binding protein [Burkholderiaceae bacterium]|nr:2Fe-2S iron-sulfur cluster-binding protein [Burkholderiaceae bacterium]
MITTNSAQAGPGACVRLEPDGRSFRCAPGQTVLAAALAAGIDLPYECASGSCGSCRAQLAAGSVRARWPEASGLSERDRRKGDRILCCQSIAQADCVIRLRPGSAEVRLPPRTVRARVASLRPLNQDVIHLVLDTEQGMDFLPGQFVLFDFGAGTGRRAYSMSNLPAGKGSLEFLIKRKPGGLAGRFLFERLQAGDGLDLEGPYGRAWLRSDSTRDIVLLAGGSGLAPIWSIAQAALARAPQRRLRLYFGANRSQDLFWLREIEQAQRCHSGLQVNLVLMETSASDPSSCRQGAAGAAMAHDIHDLHACDLYMAGPPGLIDSVMRELVATGRVPADRVFFDRFC